MNALFGRRAQSMPQALPSSATESAPAGICRNCGADAPGEYCPACGQETTIALPTLRVFMREAAGRYVALDGRLWRTLYSLFFRPGFLTREFFAGRRRRYIRPARLFLVLSIGAFAVLRFTAEGPLVISDEGDTEGVQVGGLHLVDPDAPKTTSASPPERTPKPAGAGGLPSRGAAGGQKTKSGASAGQGTERAFDPAHDVGLALGPDLDLQVDVSDQPALGALNQRVQSFNHLSRQEKNEALRAGVLRYGPYAMIVLLPLFALLMKIAYLGRGRRYPLRPRRYTAHLVFGAHNHAFLFVLVAAFALVDLGLLRAALIIWAVVYLIRSMKLVYGGRWSGVVVRAAFVSFGYLFFFSIAVAGLVVAAALIR